LRRQLLAAQAEAARLAADNARYIRLIDNPDWGEGDDGRIAAMTLLQDLVCVM
jgi:hypothetical protein